AQAESIKKENVENENLHGIDKEFETRPDETLCMERAKLVTTFWRIKKKHSATTDLDALMSFLSNLVSEWDVGSGQLCGSTPRSPVIHQPPQELSIQEIEDLKQQYLDKLKRLSNLEYRDEIKIAELIENFNGMSIEIRKKEKLMQLEQWAYLSTHPLKRLHFFCYDDDVEDYTLAVTPSLSTEEPDNSLSMGDEHLDTIPVTKSDEVIKSSVETLILIPSESEGIPDQMCDVPFHDNSLPLDVSKDQFEDPSESNEEVSLIDDDSFSIDNIDYVEASPPNSELVSSEVMEIIIPEVGGIDDDILLTTKDDILRENLLNVNHLFTKIEASNDNPIPFYDPIISGTPPNLTPSGVREGDMLLLEAFLNDDHSFDFKTKSSSISLHSLLEETNNFDNSLPEFTTVSNDLFDAKYESDSNDDQSCSDEGVLEKIILKPLFKEEIIPMKIDQHPVYAESTLMESLRTHDSSLLISSKIDSLLDEFADELTLLKSIPPRIDETDCDFEEDVRLIEKLLYGNSSPRPPEEFVSINSDAKIKSFSPSHILVKDSDSLMEEIELFCTPDYPMSPGIEEEDYDSKRDILIRKDLPSNNTLSFAEKESFHFDIPPFSRPPAKPPDGDTRILNIKMIGYIFDQKAFMQKLMITLASHQEKSPDLLSHRGLKASQPFSTCPESEGIPNNKCDVPFHDNSPPLDISKDQFEDFFESNDDFTLIDDDSFSIDDIEYVEASPPDSKLVSLEVVEIIIPKVRGIDADILPTIKDDILREKLLNVNLLIAKIKALKDNPTPSFDFMTMSSSTSLNFLLEETNTFDNYLPESKTFCFNLEEISSGSTTTHFDYSLSDYEAFYDNHVKDISSGSTTTHSNFSLYDSFIFDLSINLFPPVDRSDFYEFSDELAYIISLPEYDCFSFKNEPNSGDFTMDVVEDTFPTRELRVHVHNVLPTLQLNLDFILFSESLFAYVIWIFLPFLLYLVAPKYLLSFRNEDTIFDPGISNYHFSSFMTGCISSEWNFYEIQCLSKILE
nr:hypothetical protein [Tanacetum cinerariifolium]